MLIEIARMIEESEPDVTFDHLKQSSHSAHGQQFLIHVCYLPDTMQYRSYVFRGGSFVAWVLDPEFDHSISPDSLGINGGIEKLISDTVAEIEEDHFEIYSGGPTNA